MIPFAAVLPMVMALAAREPLTQRQAPRSVALEISRVAESLEEAAVMAVTAWHESRFVPDAIGDHGQSLCAWQLQTRAPVLRDLRRCAELAHARLRESAEACPAHPLAVYASGRCDWAWPLSDNRMRDARRLLTSR
jgi:hypothetical protein